MYVTSYILYTMITYWLCIHQLRLNIIIIIKNNIRTCIQASYTLAVYYSMQTVIHSYVCTIYVTRSGKRCIVHTWCQKTDFINIWKLHQYTNSTCVCYCQQLISRLFLRLLSPACQTSTSAWEVFIWPWWLLVKSNQAVTRHTSV